MNAYVMPRSLTWWASFVPMVLGVFVAAEPVHGLVGIVTVIDNMTGGIHPAVLINAGLAGIGLRRAIG